MMSGTEVFGADYQYPVQRTPLDYSDSDELATSSTRLQIVTHLARVPLAQERMQTADNKNKETLQVKKESDKMGFK
jgi:hypothetical protein